MVNGPHRRLDRARRQARSRRRSASSTSRTCAGSSTRSSAQVGRRIDEASPMVDARLPDGSRVNAVIPPLALSGPAAHDPQVLRGPAAPRGPRPRRTLTPETAEFIEALRARPAQHHRLGRDRRRQDDAAQRAVGARSPTTSASSPSRTRPSSSCARPRAAARVAAAQHRGRGRGHRSATCAQLACACGPTGSSWASVRGGEALDMLQAMNTGHDGSLTTVHANSPRDALSRIETMVLMAGFDLPAPRDPRADVVRPRPDRPHRAHAGRRAGASPTSPRSSAWSADVITLQELFEYRIGSQRGRRRRRRAAFHGSAALVPAASSRSAASRSRSVCSVPRTRTRWCERGIAQGR